MGFKDLINKAKAVKKRADKAGDNLRTKLEKHQADSVADRARREADEAKRLNEKLERLQAQEKRLREKDATQAAIKQKRRQIAELQSRVTTSGKIVTILNREATKLLKQSKKPREKKRRKK